MQVNAGSGLAPGQTNGVGQAPADPGVGQAPHHETAKGLAPGGLSPSDLEALRAENAQLKADKAALLDDVAKTRSKRNADREAATRALEEQGQFKALAEERGAQLAEYAAQIEELGGFRADAELWRAHQRAEQDRISQAAQSLTEGQRAILDAIPDVSRRALALAEFQAVNQKPAPKALAIPPGSPASTGGSFDGLSGDALAEAIRRDGPGWAKHVAAGNGARKTVWQRMRG